MAAGISTRTKRITAAVLLLAIACGPSAVDRRPLPAECPPGEDRRIIQWHQVDDAEERADLIRWCAAVGPPVVERPDYEAPASPVDSLAVVTWNTHVGGGALSYFIRQLRTGVLTYGKPVPHFAVLLQETYRAGPEVPAVFPADAKYADEIFPSRDLGTRRDVRDIAREHGLFVYYVPAMRNGGEDDPPEDRGNAILSTLPLSDFVAWELPRRYQRRVTIGAAIEGVTSRGEAWRLLLISIHLDHRTGIRAFVQSFSSVRLEQVEFFLAHVGDVDAAVVGGDLNTWLGESHESGVKRLRDEFPEPRDLPTHGTLKFGAVLERQTDFLFFRLPDQWRAQYRRIVDTYGSDHYPLLGWIRFGDQAEREQRAITED